MAAQADNKSTTEKPVSHHVDDDVEESLKHGETAREAMERGQGKSGLEHLSPIETIKTFKFATAVGVLASFCAATEGYQAVMNGSILANAGFVDQFATKTNAEGEDYLESPIITGWSMIMTIGQMIGLAGTPFISGNYGRKAAMYATMAFLLASILAESLARTWQIWLVGKMLAGFGVGGIQAIFQAYLSEIAPVRIRGAMTMLYQFWWALGSFCGQVALREINARTPDKYLTAIYSQWGHVGVMFIIFIILPESPSWYASKGREADSKKTLKWLYGRAEIYDVDHQYNLLTMLLEHERALAIEQNREHWYAIFQGTNGRRTFIAGWCPLAMQLIGMKVFLTFGTYFFQQAGISQPFTVKCITSSIQTAGVIFNVLTVERLGRRPLACISCTVCWVCCIVVGILGVAPETKATIYVFVLFACIWNFCLITLGAAAAGTVGEISNERLRPYTAGFAQLMSCLCGIIMDVLVPYMTNDNKWGWGYKTGWFYAGTGVIATAGAWYLIPETKGRTTAELDELFERKIQAWNFGKTETATQQLLRSEGIEAK
ncbi:general substrate transporter [Aspergillus pseudoustus]|uniref:General substrate transporter n=1 Tax=Aspergillus pseudoustus TaxID=1810923 RepID=A0ABR4KFH8_9EURO